MSHVLRRGVPDQIAFFRAYDVDNSAKTNLTAGLSQLTLSVFRVGATPVSIASLTDKAADNTAHSDGAIRQVSGNLYTVDLPDAATAEQVPSIVIRGSYNGGVIEGIEHPVVGYDPEEYYATEAEIEIATEEIGSRRVVVPVSAIPAQIVRRVDSKLLMRRWASFPYVVENVGDLAGVEKVVFTVKSDRDSDSDAQSLVQVVLSIPADPGDGIKYINGSVATEGQVTLGSIVVEDYVESDEDRKRIVIEITSAGTALIPVKNTAYWDVKLVYEDDSEVLDEGTIEIRTSVGRV